MADLELNIILLELDLQKAATAFLRKCPKQPIEDPENPGEMIEDPTTKQWVEEWLKNKLFRAIDAGITLESSDYADRLTRAIFG